MKTVKLLVLLFCTAYPKCVQSNPKIIYEAIEARPGFHEKSTLFNKEVVTSGINVTVIEVLSDFPILKKGMLNISSDISSFYIVRHNLETIEPGVFDDQKIANQIFLRINKLKVISTGTFKNLRITFLDLSHNQITHLEEGALRNLPNLQSISLMHNRIAQFSATSVVNTPSLFFLGLDHNYLTRLSEESFAFTTSSDGFIIAASNNDIEEIDPKAFDRIVLKELRLQHNKMKKISANIFKNQSLEFLDLRDNQVASLPEELLRQKKISQIYLQGNPLLCDIKNKIITLEDKFDVDKFIEEHSKCFLETSVNDVEKY